MIENRSYTEVAYLCEAQHVTRVRYHSGVTDYPKVKHCSTCHKEAVYAGSVTMGKGEHVPNPKNTVHNEEIEKPDDFLTQPIAPGSTFTNGHLKELFARRTEEELEALLSKRLEKLRDGSLHQAQALEDQQRHMKVNVSVVGR